MLVRLAANAMGTRFELVLAGADAALLHAAGEAAIGEVLDQHARLSLFDPGSVLSRINRAPAGEPVPVDDEMADLLRELRAFHADTGGAFDPTVAPAMAALGLHDAGSSAWGVAKAGGAPGFGTVRIDPSGRTVRFAQPGTALDLGAVGKGVALRAAARVLREARVEAALVHGGCSSVLAIGAPPGAPAWRVRLGPGPGAPCVALRDASLSVSAPRGRAAPGRGRVCTHILDPRTGAPASGVRTAGVVADCPVLCEAWSTALVVRPDLACAVPVGALAFLEDDQGWTSAGAIGARADDTQGLQPECVWPAMTVGSSS